MDADPRKRQLVDHNTEEDTARQLLNYAQAQTDPKESAKARQELLTHLLPHVNREVLKIRGKRQARDAKREEARAAGENAVWLLLNGKREARNRKTHQVEIVSDRSLGTTEKGIIFECIDAARCAMGLQERFCRQTIDVPESSERKIRERSESERNKSLGYERQKHELPSRRVAETLRPDERLAARPHNATRKQILSLCYSASTESVSEDLEELLACCDSDCERELVNLSWRHKLSNQKIATRWGVPLRTIQQYKQKLLNRYYLLQENFEERKKFKDRKNPCAAPHFLRQYTLDTQSAVRHSTH